MNFEAGIRFIMFLIIFGVTNYLMMLSRYENNINIWNLRGWKLDDGKPKAQPKPTPKPEPKAEKPKEEPKKDSEWVKEETPKKTETKKAE